MEPTYSDIVQFRYPTAVAYADYYLLSDGVTVTLTSWNVTKLGAKPTLAELDTYRDACRTWLKWKQVRVIRAPLLADADINWNRANDLKNGLSRDAWETYRKALRDLPAAYASAGPDAVVWPDVPTKPTTQITGQIATAKLVSGVSTAAGTFAYTFLQPYAEAPSVQGMTSGSGTQVFVAFVSNVTTTGCAITLVRSKGTLLLSAGPFEPAPSGSPFTLMVSGVLKTV